MRFGFSPKRLARHFLEAYRARTRRPSFDFAFEPHAALIARLETLLLVQGRDPELDRSTDLYDELSALPAGDPALTAVMAHFLAACMKPRFERFLAQSQPMALLWQEPTFIKALEIYADGTGRLRPLFERQLSRFLRSRRFRHVRNGRLSAIGSPRARAHALELATRYSERLGPAKIDPLLLPRTPNERARRLDGRRHVFIGFYGQLRFADLTLPPLIAALRRGFTEALGPEVEISLGCATWRLTGQRAYDRGEPAAFVLAQLPQELEDFATGLNVATVADFETAFPAVAAQLRDRSLSNASVDAATIERLAGGPVACDIGTDEAFLEDLGGPISHYLGAAMLNQGRMLDRIAALQPLMLAAEAKSGPVTDVLLLRPDLTLDGSLKDVIVSMSAQLDENRVFLDFDAAAIFLDGVGDRYFYGTRHAASRLFDAKRLLKDILSRDDLAIHRNRIAAHRFLGTVLYTHGTKVGHIPYDRINPRLFRGRLTLGDIDLALRSDSLSSPDQRARRWATDRVAGA